MYYSANHRYLDANSWWPSGWYDDVWPKVEPQGRAGKQMSTQPLPFYHKGKLYVPLGWEVLGNTSSKPSALRLAMENMAEITTIRRFSDAALQTQIDKVLAQVPADKPVAVIAHADTNGAALSAMVRLGDQWSVLAAAYKPWKGALSAEAELVWTP